MLSRKSQRRRRNPNAVISHDRGLTMAADHVVILFSYDRCVLDEGTRCPMEVIGPMSAQEAEAEVARQPAEFLPHRFRLTEPGG